MKVELFTMSYNEEKLLPHFIKHYRDMIPDIEISIGDNESTDKTALIAAESGGCKLVNVQSGGEMREDILTNFKNNVWKSSRADWIIVCDVDEFVDISIRDLEETKGTYFQCKAYDMVSESFDLQASYGIQNPMYDKICVFNRKHILDINYGVGCHQAFPRGNTILSEYRPPLYHMKYLGLDYMIEKSRMHRGRVSELNKKNKWGQHDLPDEELIRIYDNMMIQRIKVKNE